MTTAGLIGGGLLVLLTAYFVLAPLLVRRKRVGPEALTVERQRDHLLRFYEQCIASIRDLDEDYAAGKMPRASYDEERELWMQRGIRVLQALHDLKTSYTPLELDDDLQIDDTMDAALEEAIAQYASAHG